MDYERFSRFVKNATLYHKNGRGLEKYKIMGIYGNFQHPILVVSSLDDLLRELYFPLSEHEEDFILFEHRTKKVRIRTIIGNNNV